MAQTNKDSFLVGLTVGGSVLGLLALSRFRSFPPSAENPYEGSSRNDIAQFDTAVAVARESETPLWAQEAARPAFLANVSEWVQGARPSDIIIAAHNEPSDWGDDASRLAKVDTAVWDIVGARRSVHTWFDPHLRKFPKSFKPVHVTANGVHCIWTDWPGVRSVASGVILFIHGGAGVLGSAGEDGILHQAAAISQLCGQRVISVDYRLAPEHPMPASTNDAVNVYKWLLQEQNIPPAQIAVMGFSSGGASCVLALQAMKRQQLPMPACGVPVSAWHFFEEREGGKHGMQWQAWQMCCGNLDIAGKATGANNDIHDPTYSFLNGDFEGLVTWLYIGHGAVVVWYIALIVSFEY